MGTLTLDAKLLGKPQANVDANPKPFKIIAFTTTPGLIRSPSLRLSAY
ncbi:hypothetical protein [Leptothermofonsia sp. ETS-13]